MCRQGRVCAPPPGLPGESLGLTSRLAALDIHDLAVANRQNLVALDSRAVLVEPDRRADDPVVRDHAEFRLDARGSAAPLVDLELQDLTGLVRSASVRRSFPPQMTTGDATPFGILSEERCKRLRVAVAKRIGSSAEPFDHALLHRPQLNC